MTGTKTRSTGTEKMQKLATAGILKPRLLNESEAAFYLGIAAKSLQGARSKLPEKWTFKDFKQAMEEKLVSPPVTKLGNKRLYDIRDLDSWVDQLPRIGKLPLENE